MTEDLKAKYADKIAALLRKAEKTDHPEEAEAFYSKAQELMAKYAIDEAMLEASRGKQARSSDPIVKEEFVLTGSFREALRDLTAHVLRNNGVKVIKLSDPGWREVGGKVYKQVVVLVGVGYKSDLDRARILDTSLQLQAMQAQTRFVKEYKYLYTRDRDLFLARRQFLFDFASGAGTKLSEATARGRAEAEKEHGSTGVALVLRDKDMMVADKFTQFFPHVRNVRRRQAAGDAFAGGKGYEAGRRADVGQPAAGGGKKKELR